MRNLTPTEIVHELDGYIVGQAAAKRAVAVALRNRYRRIHMEKSLREEFIPKNILMMGPTGVGKTEIARRLSKLVRAPFVKVEASKFTEVGYVGRDVESIVRDLAEAAVHMVHEEMLAAVQERAAAQAEEELLAALMPTRKRPQPQNAIEALLSGQQQPPPDTTTPEEKEDLAMRRADLKGQLAAGQLEDQSITIEVSEMSRPMEIMPGSGMEINLGDMLGGMMPKKTRRRTLTVAQARPVLQAAAAERMVDKEAANAEALSRAANDGIVFIDEIDKIAGGGSRHGGPDVSREGVQRDILPIVEGCTVSTKYGPIKTDHVLFIAAGAFHVSRPEDLIPELQGRFPVRVELESLTVDDFVRILTNTQQALLKQYQALLKVDNVNLTFSKDGVLALAKAAFEANESAENLGARRLHGMVEELLEDIAFHAGGDHPVVKLKVDAAYVRAHLKAESRDTKKYIL